MAEATPPAGDGAGSGRDQDSQRGETDWIAAESSPEFRELIAKRRSFVLPATIFFFVWYFGFIALAGYAPDFMGISIYQGFTVGYLIALTQFLMVWGLGAMYLKRANRDFDPLAQRAAETALVAGRRGGAEPGPARGGGDGPAREGEVSAR